MDGEATIDFAFDFFSLYTHTSIPFFISLWAENIVNLGFVRLQRPETFLFSKKKSSWWDILPPSREKCNSFFRDPTQTTHSIRAWCRWSPTTPPPTRKTPASLRPPRRRRQHPSPHPSGRSRGLRRLRRRRALLLSLPCRRLLPASKPLLPCLSRVSLVGTGVAWQVTKRRDGVGWLSVLYYSWTDWLSTHRTSKSSINKTHGSPNSSQ